MLLCYICSKLFSTISIFLRHLKLQHHLSSNARFACKQNQCVREFQTLFSFKRHLLNKHKSDETDEIYEPKNTETVSADLSIESSDTKNIDSSTTSSDNQNYDLRDINTELKSIQNHINHSAASYVTDLYDNTSLTRQHVQDIVELTQNFISETVLNLVKNQILTTLEDTHINETEKREEIERLFNTCENPFANLDTEYKRQLFFAERGIFIEPKSYVIGQTMQSKYVKGALTLLPTNVTGQFISITSILQKLLEIPGTLNDILTNMDNLSRNTKSISNICQGKLWQHIKKKFGSKIVIPIIVYLDEFECNNPLGAHVGVHKIGAVYFSLPCIPAESQAKLENIFTTLLFHHSDRVEFGNQAAFAPLLNELKELELSGFTGITGEKLYVACTLVVGDNLGVHEICGFVQSFSANYSCRICKVPRTLMKTQTKEVEALLRTVDEYENDLEHDDVSSTGLTERCIWNVLLSYHVFINLCADAMHDVFEGVCIYDMTKLILNFIESKYFTLGLLNARIAGFDFGLTDAGNRPPFLTIKKLTSGKLGFSATETMTFVKCFGLIIGDQIPVGDQYWDLYLSLREIINIISMRSFTIEDTILLEALVSEHHEMYLELFSDSLKFKHHILLHYPRIMRLVGPLINVWCMRYEAKHKQSKIAAHVTCSRINLPRTLAMKHQSKLCKRLFNNTGFTCIPSHGRVLSKKAVRNLPHYAEFKTFLPESYSGIHWSLKNNICYKSGMVLSIGCDELLPLWGRIHFIFMDNLNNPFFILQHIETVGLNAHAAAYEVQLLDKWSCIPYTSVHSDPFPLNILLSADGLKHIICTT